MIREENLRAIHTASLIWKDDLQRKKKAHPTFFRSKEDYLSIVILKIHKIFKEVYKVQKLGLQISPPREGYFL